MVSSMTSGGMQQSQNLSLQQTLAPQLQQSLGILQAPVLELRALIQQEMEENPTLEDDEFSESDSEETSTEEDDFDEEFDQLAQLDDEWREYMAQTSSYSKRSEEEEERRQHFLESQVSTETLQQHLVAQLGSTELDSDDLKLGELIIGNIDDNGLLQTSPAETAANTGLEQEDLERVLKVIRRFHPIGVGASDLRDCLLIQLRRLGKEASIEYRIVDQYLKDLAKKRYPEIARKLGTNVPQIQRAATFIATLSPKPGQIFSADPHNFVQPDVAIELIEGEYEIVLSGDQIPHLRISNTYKDMMAQKGNTDGIKSYIRDKIRGGKFLIKSIHQRQQTIWNIANQILQRQRAFLGHGPAQLKPMTMSQVADVVGIHETTVSRAISGKYIATPQGVFEMKYFFTPGYTTEDGKVLSNTSVKGALEDLVKNENSKKPLSDKEIVDILADRGIPIARRTVAKYRNELGILPSNMRRGY